MNNKSSRTDSISTLVNKILHFTSIQKQEKLKQPGKNTETETHSNLSRIIRSRQESATTPGKSCSRYVTALKKTLAALYTTPRNSSDMPA